MSDSVKERLETNSKVKGKIGSRVLLKTLQALQKPIEKPSISKYLLLVRHEQKSCLIYEVNVGVRLTGFFILHLQMERRICTSAEDLVLYC